MKYEKLTKLSLRDHPHLNERWVQERIAEDPALLGLGDVILKDKERIQPRAGRLDLLFQEVEGNRRYEVEIQLGKTDESHVIRAIEYWDIERKRYPQYDHTAVIVAEEITSRFLNVISLFNGTIPLMAIQLNAVQLGDTVSLVFTTVLDQVLLGMVGEDEESHEVTDRAYWENRGTKATLGIVDDLLKALKRLDPRLELKYNKFYIGLARDGVPDNFVIFRPQKAAIRVEPRMKRTEAVDQSFDSAGIEVIAYDNKWGRYRLRVAADEVTRHAEALRHVLEAAYKESAGTDVG